MSDDSSDDSNTDEGATREEYERKIAYLEQIRDYTYKDVLLADTKAAFAITIAAGSMAANVALASQLSATSQVAAIVQVFGAIAVAFSALSIGCSMLTVLPRSYVSHEMATDDDHWVQMQPGWRHAAKRRAMDAMMVVYDNVWQQQTKGTPQSLALLIKNADDAEQSFYAYRDAMRRAILVQNLKYLWVGKAVLFSFGSFALVALVALRITTSP